MTTAAIGPITIDADVEATSRTYLQASAPDKSCCNACATFVLAASRDALPRELVHFLQQIGVDATKALEAWGTPEAGFLAAWWPFIGAVPPASFQAAAPLSDGVTVRVTDRFPRPLWANAREDVYGIELIWESPTVSALEREAWHSVGA